MFTGIITRLGTVKDKSKNSITVACGALAKSLRLGQSVSVNGACLTVARRIGRDAFLAEVMPESWQKTMLGDLQPGSRINLELALKAGGRLDGHIVQGHVDGTGKILRIIPKGNSRLVDFAVPPELAAALVAKGSVAVNGVSLTVIAAAKNRFRVGLIPHTWRQTAFAGARAGDRVNIETDIVAKYLIKLFRTDALAALGRAKPDWQAAAP